MCVCGGTVLKLNKKDYMHKILTFSLTLKHRPRGLMPLNDNLPSRVILDLLLMFVKILTCIKIISYFHVVLHFGLLPWSPISWNESQPYRVPMVQV